MKLDPAGNYRQLAVQGASPVGLIVLLYDAVLESLHGGLHALEANNIEQRTAQLNRALSLIGALKSALDHTRGGEIARRLERFYDLSSGKILEASIKLSPEILRQLASQFFSLREAWEQVESTNAKSASQSSLSEAATSSSTAPPTVSSRSV